MIFSMICIQFNKYTSIRNQFILFLLKVVVNRLFPFLMQKVENRLEATKRVMERSIKLFLLGIILQGRIRMRFSIEIVLPRV